jgi:hypothetical protein
MTETTSTTGEDVATFKQRVYTEITRQVADTHVEEQVQRWLRELNLAPILVFAPGEDETVESLTAALYAKVDELERTGEVESYRARRLLDDLGLERPGTRPVTVRLAVRLSPQEAEQLADGRLSLNTVLARQQPQVTVQQPDSE